MLSIHNVKEILIISGFSLLLLYTLKKELHKSFNKNLLCVYKYSIPFFFRNPYNLEFIVRMCVFVLLCGKICTMVIDIDFHRICACDL